MFLQKRLLITRDPAENFRLAVQLLHEVVNFEFYNRVRLTLSGIGRRPGDMGQAMMFIYRRDADIPYPHPLGSYLPIAGISQFHDT